VACIKRFSRKFYHFRFCCQHSIVVAVVRSGTQVLVLTESIVRCCSDAGEKQYKFEEILPVYKQANEAAESGTFADFMEAFKTFDREGQGFINAAELRHVLTSLGRYNTHYDIFPSFGSKLQRFTVINT